MKYVHHERTKETETIIEKIKEMHEQTANENSTIANFLSEEPRSKTLKKLALKSYERAKALEEVLSLFDVEIRF